MTSESLIDDLQHRHSLATALARYADGREGRGLGTALAGLIALIGPVIIWFAGDATARYAVHHTTREAFRDYLMPRYYLMSAAILLMDALLWLYLKDKVQAWFYRRHGEARSALPLWDLRLGIVLLMILCLAGFRIGAGNVMALNGTPPSVMDLWGGPMLKLMAGLALLGTATLILLAWRRIQGWRNWLAWAAFCAPFLIIASAPLLDDRQTGVIMIVLALSLAIAAYYLPFAAIYIGLRDHLRYRRLLKELGGLAAMEEQP